MNAFVTDTHPLVWYSAGHPRKLGSRARASFAAFERGETILYVPLAVVMESAELLRLGVIRSPLGLAEWWSGIRARPNVVIETLDFDAVVATSRLAWTHRDPFDRLIVSCALTLGLPLATADHEITEWGGVPILW